MKKVRFAADRRRPMFWWGVVIVSAIVLAGLLLTMWYDQRTVPEPEPMPETGAETLYLPRVDAPTHEYHFPPCVTILDVYDAWTAAGLVDEPLRAAFVVGFDLSVPDSCLPYLRYRRAGYTGLDRGELYLCQNTADVPAVVARRGAGRAVWSCGPWVLTAPWSYPADTVAELWTVVRQACGR